MPRGEAIFLTKLDLTLISSAALGVMIRYLDQRVPLSSIFTVKQQRLTMSLIELTLPTPSVSFLIPLPYPLNLSSLTPLSLSSHRSSTDSGMKEDLNLYGNELNYANAFWSAAYVIGQIPSNLILTRVNAPRYIAFIELAWTAFTFGSAGVKNTRTLYALRFL